MSLHLCPTSRFEQLGQYTEWCRGGSSVRISGVIGDVGAASSNFIMQEYRVRAEIGSGDCACMNYLQVIEIQFDAHARHYLCSYARLIHEAMSTSNQKCWSAVQISNGNGYETRIRKEHR